MRGKAILAALLVSGSLAFTPDQKCCKPATGGGGDQPDDQGGIVEEYTDTDSRDPDALSMSIPTTRTRFQFPAPYSTYGVRLTILADCAGSISATDDCVRQTGYSDWQNIFYDGLPGDAAQDTICFWNGMGYLGPHKGCYTWSTDTHSGWVKIFEPGDPLENVNSATDSWQTSPRTANMLYVKRESEYLRCDTGSGIGSLPIDSDDCTSMGDILSIEARTAMASALGGVVGDYLGTIIWSPHVAADDATWSATIRQTSPCCADLGAIFRLSNGTWVAKPAEGDPFVDLSATYGAYAVDAAGGCGATSSNDFIVFELASPSTSFTICDTDGAPGHLAFGFGYMLASDNEASAGGGAGYEQVKLWNLANIAGGGTLVTSYPSNLPNGFGQPAWGAAVPAGTTAIANQQVCHTNVASGGAPDPVVPRERELYCYRPGDPTVIVVAPQMTDVDATGTGGDDETSVYYRGPKPNVSSSGRWYYLVSNKGAGSWDPENGTRMDAFLVRIPRANLPMPGPAPSLLATLLRFLVAPWNYARG